MNVRGRIENGVVVLDPGPVLPEGAVVTVSYQETSAEETSAKQRITLPLVPSDHPGSISLTSDRIAELLDDADVSP